MYLVKTPPFVQFLFKRLIWRFVDTKKVYLTFDDGPVPEATPWVLDVLKEAEIKATFFCVGENVKKYPEIYQRILEEGHTVGNHTYNHLNAWKTKSNDYLSNIDLANDEIDSKLFRPPYGKLSPKLSKKIDADYDIIMWDILSGDFDSNISAEKCLTNVTAKAREGSIIVFHDSVKAIDKLKFVLPKVIDFFKSQEIEMGKIEIDR
ncbi:MAG: peptidoglycan/xylan/chitin deacetylase (PgdA/CDA1 family) [Saprospiraceae bacterium]|jgi:peptidoglycan/xylan/chitin deacetylase (PgdA/CDA1 family)|tara:strand:+ start:598 stop:1215 length:618 start_codon:yes stop_codon:yes gene_type:complete